MVRTTTINLCVEVGLRFVGMWSSSAYPNLYWTSYMIFIVVMLYHQCWYIVSHFGTLNLSLLMDSLGVFLAMSLTTLKIALLRWNRRIIHNSLSVINEDWKEGINGDFSRSTMIIAADKSHRCSCLIIAMYAMAGLLYTTNLINNEVREFPLKMEFLFNSTISPLFECILACQFFYLLTNATINGMINALLISLVFHIGGQIDIMKQDIMQISTSDDPRKSLAIIRDLVFRHRKIIALSDKIETMFTAIALLQFLWNTLIICCSGLMIVITLSSNKDISVLAKCIVLYVVKTLEVFVFCYAGEFLSAKSKSISDAVYESLWYDTPPTTSRVLLFIIIRSQKRLTMTAGKVVDLTLDGFMSVMKASVSYMSVLHAMY